PAAVLRDPRTRRPRICSRGIERAVRGGTRRDLWVLGAAARSRGRCSLRLATRSHRRVGRAGMHARGRQHLRAAVSRRALGVGCAIVAAYLVVLGVTVRLRPDHARPLYDSFVAPESYQFVDPPAFFAAGNVEPKAVSRRISLGASGSVPAGIATPDGQFV